jgi:YidC/Oxa1 family membrane protein insertase
MLGCLPMLLQMPIWIALWAMLYLAFDLRQQPAFYGLFQAVYDRWAFLADLSSPDKFIPLGAGFTIPLLGIQITAINLLPLLMGVVFFIQQKYLTPPTTANMTPEQLQQQKIMKWMMVILFPLMMYKAPSGLTLYIMTSSIIGILEGRYVRRHIEELDKNPPPPRGGANDAKPKKKDSLARAWAERLEAIREKQRLAQQGSKSFKKRK